MCLIDAQSGEVIEEGRLRTDREVLKGRFGGCEPMRIAIETGTHSPWTSRLLEECGHEVLVANARKVRLIYAGKRKTDKLDAENLARLARLDPELLSPIEHRDETSQAHLALLRSREALIDTRTQLINHVREFLVFMSYVAVYAALAVPVFTYIAILRYRLYDIDVIINRTLVYGALSACVVLIYVLAVVALGALFQARGNLAVSLLATGLVATLFQPLRGRLQRGVDRLMYGERDDPYAVISRLGRRLEAALAPRACCPRSPRRSPRL